MTKGGTVVHLNCLARPRVLLPRQPAWTCCWHCSITGDCTVTKGQQHARKSPTNTPNPPFKRQRFPQFGHFYKNRFLSFWMLMLSRCTFRDGWRGLTRLRIYPSYLLTFDALTLHMLNHRRNFYLSSLGTCKPNNCRDKDYKLFGYQFQAICRNNLQRSLCPRHVGSTWCSCKTVRANCAV